MYLCALAVKAFAYGDSTGTERKQLNAERLLTNISGFTKIFICRKCWRLQH